MVVDDWQKRFMEAESQLVRMRREVVEATEEAIILRTLLAAIASAQPDQTLVVPMDLMAFGVPVVLEREVDTAGRAITVRVVAQPDGDRKPRLDG